MTIRAQVDQAKAAVEAARAGIEENSQQRQLQDTRIAKALAGIDQAKAQIAAAEAGKQAVQAQLIHARSERKRQEGLVPDTLNNRTEPRDCCRCGRESVRPICDP